MKWCGGAGERIALLAVLVGMLIAMVLFPNVCILLWVIAALVLMAAFIH